MPFRGVIMGSIPTGNKRFFHKYLTNVFCYLITRQNLYSNRMLFFSKINFLTSRIFNKPGFFLFQDTLAIYTEISAKKKTKCILNKSPHVHKKSKERFTFFWPRRFTYTTPTFSDVFSLNSFISFFFKKSSVFLTTSQFCFKTITIVKKILCLF